MNDCCYETIDRYLAIVGAAQENAALCCRVCLSRLVYSEGVWGIVH